MRSFLRFRSPFRHADTGDRLSGRRLLVRTLLLWGLLAWGLWGHWATPASATSTSFANSTFIQLIADNEHWTSRQWENLFQEMQGMGIREVVIQWTRYGEKEFIPQVETVLTLAAQHGMQVWVGLYHPEDWWTQISKPAQLLEVYLWQVLHIQLDVARRVVELFGASPAFAGLYLPTEIDDGTWHSADKTRILLDCLHTFASWVESEMPGRVWAISGFSNGIVPPQPLANFWKNLMQAGNIQHLYFQDGVGVGKLTPPEAATYIRALSLALIPQKKHVVAVVEAFTQTDGTPINDRPFAARPAPFQRLQRQVTLARDAGAVAVVFFAVPNYMSSQGGAEAATLGRRWRDAQQKH